MKIVYLLLVVFISFLFTMCRTSTKSSPKPSSIPPEAVWYGGQDGGHWMVVKKGNDKNAFYISIYNDFTGEIEKETLFSLSKSCCDLGFNIDSIYKHINAYDGERVLLSIIKEGKSCYLKPKKEE